MNALFSAADGDAVDLMDAVCLRLEQAQTLAMSLSEKIENLQADSTVRHRLASEIGAVSLQISEAQSLSEILTHRLNPVAD